MVCIAYSVAQVRAHLKGGSELTLIEDVEAYGCHKRFVVIVEESLENTHVYGRLLDILYNMTANDEYTVEQIFEDTLDLANWIKSRISETTLRKNSNYS